MFSYVRTLLSTKEIVKNYIPLNVFGIPLIMVSRLLFFLIFKKYFWECPLWNGKWANIVSS